MKSPQITILKSPDTGEIEITVHDSIYAVPGQLYIIPEKTEILDPSEPYREHIKQLEYELKKCKRGKKHILNNLRNSLASIK